MKGIGTAGKKVNPVTLLLVFFAVLLVLTVFLAPTLHYSLVRRSSLKDLEHPLLSTNLLQGITVKTIDGIAVDLNAVYRDKVVLIVNMASHCGFTQLNYRELELLQEHYNKDFAVLAFPCNQFGNAEGDSPSEIARFAKVENKVTFNVFEKVNVNGPSAHPFFVRLKAHMNVSDVEWNFGKFLLGKGGAPLRYYDHRFPFVVIRRHIDALVRL